jgi:hypothetical protein
MSTPSRCASSPARPAGRTLKPMMIASEAMARLTSVSVIAPTPRWMTQLDLLADVELEQRVLQGLHRAGHVALDDQVELLDARPFSAESRSSSVTRCGARRTGVALAGLPRSAICRAIRSSVDDKEVVAGPGTADRALHLDGRDGPPRERACRPRRAWPGRGRRRRRPRSSHRRAACRAGPARSPPAPRPLSRWASIATPCASWSGWPAGRATRRRSADRLEQAVDADLPWSPRRRRTWCRRRTPRRPGRTR